MRNAEASYGVGIGHYAGRKQLLNPNVFIGGLAASNVAGGGKFNAIVGNKAAYALADGFYNVIVGSEAGYSINDGYGNIFMGRLAGYNVTDGDGNIIIGSGSLGEAALEQQLRIGSGDSLTTISASLVTGDIIFPSTASAAYFSGDGSKLTNLPSTSGGLWSGSAAAPTATGNVSITGSLTVSGSFHSFTLGSDNIVLGSGTKVNE
jgi:hypothetical protein